MTFHDDLLNHAELHVSAASHAEIEGRFCGNGASGDGTVNPEAGICPGDSPGTISFGGNLVFGPGTTLEIELGGTEPGQYDVVDVANRVVLDGTLQIILIDDFVPSVGDTFEILRYGAVEGDFAQYRGLELGDGLRLDFGFTQDGLASTVVPEPSTWILMALAGLCLLAYTRRDGRSGRSAGVRFFRAPAGYRRLFRAATSGRALQRGRLACPPRCWATLAGLSVATLLGTARPASAASFYALGGRPDNDFSSYAQDVSANGWAVVGYINSAAGDEAFRWTTTGGMEPLGDLLGGGDSSRAYGVSADGSVVVGAGLSAYGQEAFRWTQRDGMSPLGDLEGGDFHSEARDVSGDGSVVVGFGTTSSGSQAFIWDAAHGMRDLKEVLISEYDAVEVAGLISLDGVLEIVLVDDFVPDLGDSFGILTFGDVEGQFAECRGLKLPNGLGLGLNFTPHGCIAKVVPEPSSIVLLGMGAVGLLLVGSRRRTRRRSCWTTPEFPRS